jgi:hypothetical protein
MGKIVLPDQLSAMWTTPCLSLPTPKVKIRNYITLEIMKASR